MSLKWQLNSSGTQKIVTQVQGMGNLENTRIVHTCLRYPPATGGAEKYVYEIVERTRQKIIDNIQQKTKKQPDIRVLTSKMRTHGPITSLDSKLLVPDPMYIQRLHHATTPFISYPRLQALEYYLSHHRPDIIHSYSFWYQPADVTARFASKNNIPFIFHPIFYTSENRRKPIWNIYKNTIGRKTFSAADVVAVISPFEQSLIEKEEFPVKRFELIPPGVDQSIYTSQKNNPYQQHKISGPVLLTVSRIATGKGLSDAINSMPNIIKHHPTASLAIVGDDFGAKSSLIKLVNSLGLQKSVKFLGRLSDEELVAAFQHATLLLHPSYYEAFGIVLAESLASGTPVVARNTSAIPYVAPHGVGSLLFKTQSELTNHVISLLNNKKRLQDLSDNGQRYVQANFSWDIVVKKIIDIYKEFNSNSEL